MENQKRIVENKAPSNYRGGEGSNPVDARELYLREGTSAFQVDRNPFSRHGEFANATGSAVAAKLDRSMSNDDTSEIQFVAAAVEMPPNTYYGNDQEDLHAENVGQNDRYHEQQKHREAVLRYREQEYHNRQEQLRDQQKWREAQQQQQAQYGYHGQPSSYQQPPYQPRWRDARPTAKALADSFTGEDTGWTNNHPRLGAQYHLSTKRCQSSATAPSSKRIIRPG